MNDMAQQVIDRELKPEPVLRGFSNWETMKMRDWIGSDESIIETDWREPALDAMNMDENISEGHRINYLWSAIRLEFFDMLKLVQWDEIAKSLLAEAREVHGEMEGDTD